MALGLTTLSCCLVASLCWDGYHEMPLKSMPFDISILWKGSNYLSYPCLVKIVIILTTELYVDWHNYILTALFMGWTFPRLEMCWSPFWTFHLPSDLSHISQTLIISWSQAHYMLAAHHERISRLENCERSQQEVSRAVLPGKYIALCFPSIFKQRCSALWI